MARLQIISNRHINTTICAACGQKGPAHLKCLWFEKDDIEIPICDTCLETFKEEEL